jgi:hypothetical protein
MLVREQVSNTDDDTRRDDLAAQTAHLALICVGTFDLEGPTLRRVLGNERDISIFLQCSMGFMTERASSNWKPRLIARFRSLGIGDRPCFRLFAIRGKGLVACFQLFSIGGSPWHIIVTFF